MSRFGAGKELYTSMQLVTGNCATLLANNKGQTTVPRDNVLDVDGTILGKRNKRPTWGVK